MSEKIKPVPHKHAALIKAWADGAIIQRCGSDNVWRNCKDYPMVWYNDAEYRLQPVPTDLDKYGAKAGDVWIVNGERLLFTFVDESVGIDCFSLASGTDGAFGWEWDEFKKGKLLFRANEVNKL